MQYLFFYEPISHSPNKHPCGTPKNFVTNGRKHGQAERHLLETIVSDEEHTNDEKALNKSLNWLKQ